MPSRDHHSNGYCCPFLGLGNTAGAEILEGDVWRATNAQHNLAGPMIHTATVGPLWGSEIPARAEILGGDVWGALKMEHHRRGQ